MIDDENLSISGDLAETTVPDLIRSIVRSGESAIVTLEVPQRADSIYLHEGRIVFAASTDPDLGLAETLLRMGELDIRQYESALERVVVARRIGATLIELGYLQPEELSRAAERQASAIVLGAMAYRQGSYTIEFTSQFPEGIVTLPLATERLILDGVRRIEYWSLIRRGVGRLDRAIEQTPGADTRLFHLDLTDDETHVLNLLSDAQTVEELCSRSYLSNFETLRTVWGLLAVNLVHDAEVTAVDEKREAERSEYELEALVERYNEAYQQIFHAVFQKIGDHVYDFVDRVVFQLGPENGRFIRGMTFVNEARVDFDQLVNNIYASGERDHARAVGEVLDWLLDGWVTEVHAEFAGQPIADEVQRIAESVRDGGAA